MLRVRWGEGGGQIDRASIKIEGETDKLTQ